MTSNQNPVEFGWMQSTDQSAEQAIDQKSNQKSNQKSEVFVFWFRRDLRLEDNRGFSEALKAARKAGKPLVPIFLFDQTILERLEDEDDARVGFIHKTLQEMKTVLRQQGSDLLVLHGRPKEIWERIAHKGLFASFENRSNAEIRLGRVAKVFANHDYEPLAIARDQSVSDLLQASGISFQTFKDQVIFEKADVVKDDGKPYTVFTPYSRKWLAEFEKRLAAGIDESKAQSAGPYFSALCSAADSFWFPELSEIGFRANESIVLPGVKVPTSILTEYALKRNSPSVVGTTRLGLHLRFGTVSIRKLVGLARQLGADAWLSELIWREFFMQILFHFPRVQEEAFRPEYDRIAWRNVPEEFERWCQGRTGFPIVDAGMRELNATGFMHNRVRMIAGSFLVKHLLVDWRWGEAYFARKLLDFDLSANNGNWQWVAGTGCDAAPYFRVFSPELQTKKFDPDLRYIRKWIPELGTAQYPAPMVAHAAARARALQAYQIVKTP